MKPIKVLETLNLSCGYSPKNPLIHHLNLSLFPGEILGILGPNGGGKSTLLRTLAGLLSPVEGEISYFEGTLSLASSVELARRRAFLPQNLEIPLGFTVEEIVRMGRHPHRGSWGRWSPKDNLLVQQGLEKVEMQSLAGRKARELSGGEIRRMFLAQILVQEPDLFLLDEPLAHLDLRHRMEVLKILKNINSQGATLILSLHDLELAGYFCDRLLLFTGDGNFRIGKSREILTSANLEEAFGLTLSVSFEGKVPSIQYPY